MAFLDCSDLAVGYDGIPVAQGIAFSAGAGEVLCVIGENGAGKSTLVKTLLGLIPPVSGTITFGDGAGVGEIGYLPQRGEAQRDFPASVWEVVLSGRSPRLGAWPFYTKEDRDACFDALARVRASQLHGMPFGKLSGGQQQRVLLARALAAHPKLLILDEPVTGLDPDAAKALYAEVDRLREDGMGVIAVTHDVDGALPHATHVLAFGAGSVSFSAVGGQLPDTGGSTWAH